MLVPLAVAMGVSAAMSFVRDGLQRDAELSTRMLPDITLQRLVGGRLEKIQWNELAQSLSRMPHVRLVAPRVWGYVPVSRHGKEEIYTVLGIDLERMPQSPEVEWAVESGRYLRAGDRGCAVVGKAVAVAFGAEAGQELVIQDVFGNEWKLQVAGVLSDAVQIYSADLILTPIEDAREIMKCTEDEAVDVCVYLDAPEHADLIAAQIAHDYPEYRILTREGLKEMFAQAFGGRGGVFQLLWLILLLTVALLAWAQASTITANARREIGIMKAVGWSTLDVIEVKLFESVILGLAGWALGMILGAGYLMGGAPGLKGYFLAWSAVYPKFPLPLMVRPSTVLMLLALATAPILAATVFPAWLVGIIDPDRAIRG